MTITFGRVFFFVACLLALNSLSGCARSILIEEPESFSKCPEITGTYTNYNTIQNKRHWLNRLDFYDFQTGWLYRTFAIEPWHTKVALHQIMGEVAMSHMWEWPGEVHIFWIDKNEQILAVIFSSKKTKEISWSGIKDIESDRFILESRYVSLTTSETIKERKNQPLYFYCSNGELKFEEGLFGFLFLETNINKNEISFNVDENKNLISHQKWHKFEAVFSAEGEEFGLWKATDWEQYKLGDVFPTSRIAAILSNLNRGVNENNISFSSIRVLANLNTFLSDADIKLRYLEDTKESCHCLEQANRLIEEELDIKQHSGLDEINVDIDTVLSDLACGTLGEPQS